MKLTNKNQSHMNHATIKTDIDTKQDVLYINGKPQICPYKTPIPVPSQLGGISIMNFSCNTNCPLMKIDENILALYCGCDKIILQLSEMQVMSKM